MSAHDWFPPSVYAKWSWQMSDVVNALDEESGQITPSHNDSGEVVCASSSS